jgi:Domain of unknown function (DUF4430)
MGLTVTISIFDDPIAEIEQVPYASGMNVQQAMQSAYDADPATRPVVRFAIEYFGSSLGYELTTLDSIAAQNGGDGQSWLFWELLINGQPSPTGIDETFPADGDTIGWNYTLYSTERHAGTRYETIRSLVASRSTQNLPG